MPNIIQVKIDVTLIDKERFFVGKPAKDGHTPKYLDLVLIPRREEGRYGDTHMVKQSITKAEREQGIELPIIGNATEKTRQPQQNAPESTQPPPQRKPEPQGIDEDCPF